MFRDGVARLVSWSDPRCGRMLPVWVLVPPQVSRPLIGQYNQYRPLIGQYSHDNIISLVQVIHSVSHYTISTLVQAAWLQVLKATHREYQRLTVSVVI